MRQKTIITSKVEMLLVDLPEDACVVKVYNHLPTVGSSIIGFYTKSNLYKMEKIVLPTLLWNVGKATELTEEDWEGIVKYVGLPWCAYVDYITNKNWFSTATESGLSLLKANGVVLENPYGKERPKINLSRDDYDEFGFVIGDGILKGKEWEEKYWDWLESEKKVWQNCHVFIKQKNKK